MTPGVLVPVVVAFWNILFASASAVSQTRDYRVFGYELELQIDSARRAVAGRELIRIRSGENALTAVSFPHNGIKVLSATSETGTPLSVTEGDDQVEIRLPVTLGRNRQLSIVVSYEATEPKGVEFGPDSVYTSFHTCHWMLCRDRPDDKATFVLALTVEANQTVVASGAPMSKRNLDAARTRHVWRESVPSAPYLFGFAVGKFSRVVRTHRGIRFEYYAGHVDQDQLWRMFADDDRMLDFFVTKAGRSLPHSFYRQVVVDGSAAQEMSSFSVLGRSQLDVRLSDPQEDWLVAHELAHQFWGNAVTCADWSHFWLNEGLAVFMVAAYKEQRWGRAAYARELALARERHRTAVEMDFDVPLAFAGDYPSLRVKRAITYSKAMLFLDRLRETMGEKSFWSALKKYTLRFAGRTAASQDLERVFAAETDRDLAPLFADWVYEAKKP